MIYKWVYKTPDGLDDILLNSDGEYLTGLWFFGSKDAFKHCVNCEEKMLPIFDDTIRWLNAYFSGSEPDFIPKYRVDGFTPFRKEVFEIMNTIKFGDTMTYNDIAKIIAKRRDIKRMSSQAVGGAVGWNPICIIIPCHRVVGAMGSLVGYGGGIENKRALLSFERINKNK